jgi:hypothetical protein
MSLSRDSVGSRVHVELADGFNFVGRVTQDYFDSRGRRTLLVEDTQGNDRTVRPALPHVSLHDLGGDRDGRGGRS